MPEVIIVSTARSPMGRAVKGSRKDVRADELASQMVSAALTKSSEITPTDVADLLLGCRLPGGGQGWNMGRNVAVILGYDHVPDATITRYCSSLLQTTRLAFHAIKAGESSVYSSAGVEVVSGFSKGISDAIEGQDLLDPRFVESAARTARRSSPSLGLIGGRQGSCRTFTSRWDRPPRMFSRCWV